VRHAVLIVALAVLGCVSLPVSSQGSTTPSQPSGLSADLLFRDGFEAIPPAFSVQVGPGELRSFPGAAAGLHLGVSRSAGFDGEVTLEIDSPPAGIETWPTVLPGDVAEGEVGLYVGDDVSPGSIPLTLKASAPGADAVSVPLTLVVSEPQPRAQAKIRQALADGIIDYGTSLLYRAYAWYGDPRLPPEYVGSGSAREDLGLYQEITAAIGGLPPELAQELAPFTLRPNDPGSWFNQPLAAPVGTGAARTVAPAARNGTGTATTATTPILATSCTQYPNGTTVDWITVLARPDPPMRVWVRCADNSQAEADRQGALLSLWAGRVNKVLPGLLGIMDFSEAEVLRDTTPTLNPTNYLGDEAIDIYITDDTGPYRPVIGEKSLGGKAGVTFYSDTVPAHATKTSAFVLVKRSLSHQPGIAQAVLVHELAHVLQFARNQPLAAPPIDNDKVLWWYADASADYLAAYFDRNDPPAGSRVAWVAVYQYFETDFQKSFAPLTDPFEDHRYGASIWPYFWEMKTGGPFFIGSTWKALEGAAGWDDADAHLDATFSFADNFRLFARRNLNTALDPGTALPRSERYVSLDEAQFKDGKEPQVIMEEKAPSPQKYHYEDEIEPLSARYWKFKFKAPTQKVTLFFEDLEGIRSYIDVDANVKIRNRGWEHRDLNGKDKEVFCFDDPDEKLEDLYLIVSNHQIKASGGVPRQAAFDLEVSQAPCEPAWEGTSTYTYEGPVGIGPSFETRANVTWLKDEDATINEQQPAFYPTGSVAVIKARDPFCGDYQVVPGTRPIALDDGQMVVRYDQPSPDADGAGGAPWEGTVTIQCPDSEPQELPAAALGIGPWLQTGGAVPLQFILDTNTGKVETIFKGTWTSEDGANSSAWEFRYRPQ
jgi:hypothetical protein